jgi:excisionase family DNA binding protein
MTEKSVKRVAQLEDLRDLISQAEAARIRGVTRAAIRDLIRRQRLRSVEVGGRALVYRSEVESFEKETPGPKKENDNE